MAVGKVLLILGSPRAGGNTAAAAHCLRQDLNLGAEQIVDLRTCNVEPFKYDADLARDDFRAVIDQMLDHQQLVFVTPVYWYAMSGLMKNFFDRLTDLLLDPEGRRLGRALAGRRIWLLATGTDEALPDGFTIPFEKTAEYFDMHWEGASYAHVEATLAPSSLDLKPVQELVTALAQSGVQ
jgi:multimeric flavodoxin WrbA